MLYGFLIKKKYLVSKRSELEIIHVPQMDMQHAAGIFYEGGTCAGHDRSIHHRSRGRTCAL
jgi:hypothetical protein